MRKKMKVLHIDSSILGEASISRQLTVAIAARVIANHANAEIEYLDLSQQDIPHLTADILMGQNTEQAALGARLVEQYLAADIVIVGAAMYNFSLASSLKAWIDRISVAGKTFKYTEQGPVGLAGDKKVYIASSRGGIYGDDSAVDFQEKFLKTVFAFTGVTDVQVIRAEGVSMGEEAKQAALKAAFEKIEVL
jgi:FMN-dependent NADH-azoreductase